MMKDYFNRYADFIQEYIYKEGWQELRLVQQETAEAIFDSNQNVLITTPTASGKTEAALFPIITKMKEEPGENIQCLYVSPLKALINDQFIRLESILEKSQIKVLRWHGDVSTTEKQKALTQNNLILQITPESIESLFINHYDDLKNIFKNLKYVIIDEVHYFASNIRGIHLMSLLSRLESIIRHPLRKIGLSATIGNPEAIATYIENSPCLNKKNTIIVKSRQEKTKIHLQIMYNIIENETDIDKYYHNIYNLIDSRRSIVFANTKQKVEETAQYLNSINENHQLRNYILVHHGNISKAIRDEVEKKMRSDVSSICAVATMTLELGIDLGKLERVVQIDVPPSINSFVQRLGRTGRKTKIQEMIFVFEESTANNNSPFYELINWNFMLTVSMIDLYTREKYLESSTIEKYPYGVLLQQTLSYLHANPGAKAKDIARSLLSLPVFKAVSLDDYRLLLQSALQTSLIEKNEQGDIYLGSLGEKIVSNYDFYAVFAGSNDFEVFYNTKLIGSVSKIIPVGSIFSLAGQTWQVKNIDKIKRRIEAMPSDGLATTSWSGSGINFFDTRLMKNLKRLITSGVIPSFLNESTKKVYQRFIDIYKSLPLDKNDKYDLIELGVGEFMILPFLGTKAFLTLYYIIKEKYPKSIFYFDHFIPLFIIIKEVDTKQEIIDLINQIKNHHFTKDNIKIYETFSEEDKYQKYLPPELIIKAYKERIIDISELADNL